MSNQLVITSGAKVRSLEGVITGSTGVLNSLPINGANGIPQLDSNGKILVSQLPNSVMEYKGTWDAATNTPTLANGTGNQGDVYLCNVAGTVNFGAGPITFYVGDQVIYSGSIWQRASGASGTVTSVAITESGDALTITGSPITTSGTINIGFAGTSAQYVAGNGSLITFPSTATAAQNLITEVYNETGATLTKGTVVYINGGHGNLPTVAKAIATSDATSAQTYGVVRADITNMNNGFVTVIGSLSDLDTQAYADGTQLYLSGTTAGAWTSTKPSAPIHLVYVGIVVRSHPTQGVVEVRIQNGYELGELHDVAISSPTNNQGIFYNSSNSLWENKSIATALGYTPANDSLVVHLAGNETITGLKTFNTPVAFDNALNVKFDASITAFGGYYSIYAIKGVNSGNSTLALYDGDTNKRISLSFYNSSDYTYLFPATSGTVALTSQLTSGTVTSVGLSSSTSGVTIGSSPVTTSGTITLSIATASGSQQGLLSSTDWTTFNSKQGAITLTTTGTSGAATLVGNTLNIPQYQAAGTYVTSVTGTSPIVSSGGTTPAISINQATTSTSGYLSSTDWNTFNNKQNALTNPVTGTGTSGQVTYFNGTSSITGSNNLKFDGTNLLIGNPSSALAQLYVYNASAAASLLLKTNSATDYSEIAVRNYNDTSTSYFRQYSSSASGSDFGISRANLALFFSNYASNFAIGTRNGGDLILGTADTERARLLASNGYLGIGTSSPQYSLDVASSGTTRIQIKPTTTTSASIFQTSGAGNIFYLGTDNSSGTEFGVGAYSSVIWRSGAYPIVIATNDTERMRITSAGNVGIGTNSPQTLLSVETSGTQNTVSPIITSQSTGTTYTGLYSIRDGAGDQRGMIFQVYTANVGLNEKMRITSAGNVGIGTSSPNLTTTNRTVLDINGTSTSLIALSSGGTYKSYIFNDGTDITYYSTGSTYINSASSTIFKISGTVEAMRITSGGLVGIGTSSPDTLLHIAGTQGTLKVASNSTSGANAPYLSFFHAGNDEFKIVGGGYLAFLSSGTTERMRITSGGFLKQKANGGNYFSPTSYNEISNFAGGSSDVNLVLGLGGSSNNTSSYFLICAPNNAGDRMYIYGNGNIVNTNGSYGTLSDATLKENIIDATPKLNDLLQLKVRNFNLIDDENKTKQIGFIAQEFEEVFPTMVDTDGKTGMKTIKTSVLVPMLVKAIQEQQKQIDELKAKIK